MNGSDLVQAINWRIRLRDGGSEDWESFVRWLEAAPGRSDLYDRVALADLDLDSAALPHPAAANDGASWQIAAPPVGTRARRRFWPVAIPAAAAALVAGLIVGGPARKADTHFTMATRPGEHRLVTLGDGSSVALNGDSRLILDRARPRSAELASGEALFRIRHDSASPFVLEAGGHVVRDLGTEFNVARDGTRLSIGVLSGAVMLDPDGGAVAVHAGQRLNVDGRSAPVVAAAEPAAMAGWQSGELSYSEAPLGFVAAELSRTAGIRVGIDPALASLSFTGSIHVAPDRAATVAALAAALGLEARRGAGGWTIERRGRGRD
jgi:transmembrane sensor